uniref:Uncharacterized protein n=1 Tax=Aegilops tauschii subsp. strangulata TaxID=200361 RepID=A0A453N1B0_AEGTS
MLRASIIRLTELAISPSTSAKSHLEGRERGREKRTGASSSAWLIRERCARLQPAASARAGALDPLSIPCASPASRASPSSFARENQPVPSPQIAFSRQIEASNFSPNRHLSQTLEVSPARIKEMGQQSKRARAPAPREAPPPAPPLVPPPAHLLVPPPAHLLVPPAPKSALPPAHFLVPPALKPAPSTHHPAIPSSLRTSTWIPPRPQQSVAASLQQPGESCREAQGPCWAQPSCIGDATSPWYMADSMDYSNPQAWGVNSHPPGGYLSYFQNTPGPTQPMHNGSSPQPVNVGDDTNGGDCGRIEKRLLWTKQEDLRLVCFFLHACWLHVLHY